jgi:hypothetical protein
MNELIEKLFEEHARLFMNDKVEILFTDFAQAIREACQAQRNACARVYEADYIDKGGYNIYDYQGIFKQAVTLYTEIEKQINQRKEKE